MADFVRIVPVVHVSAMGTIIRVYGHETTVTIGNLALDLFVYFPDWTKPQTTIRTKSAISFSSGRAR